MTEFIDIIYAYLAIWAPSLVAILGIIASVVLAAAKVKSAITDLKSDETIKALRAEVKASNDKNNALLQRLDTITDELTKIKNYNQHKGG